MSNHLVIFDLEATCWQTETPSANRSNKIFLKDSPDWKQQNEMETIEIGAAKVDSDTYDIIDTFQGFIKPVINPILTNYCTTLTTITQNDVNSAGLFSEVFPKFVAWSDSPNYYIGWGAYDQRQLATDSIRHSVQCFPKELYINGKELYMKFTGHRGRGLKKAVKKYRLEFEGTQHRAISDAIMTARVLQCAKNELFKKIG